MIIKELSLLMARSIILIPSKLAITTGSVTPRQWSARFLATAVSFSNTALLRPHRRRAGSCSMRAPERARRVRAEALAWLLRSLAPRAWQGSCIPGGDNALGDNP